MRAMKDDENSSLGVTLIMKFNHILKCNHEIVINILQCLTVPDIYNYTCICQDLLGILTYEVGMNLKYACKDIIKMCFERYYYIMIMYLFYRSQR